MARLNGAAEGRKAAPQPPDKAVGQCRLGEATPMEGSTISAEHLRFPALDCDRPGNCPRPSS
jgi:hypothetical protein